VESISRRAFLKGFGATAAAPFVPGCERSQQSSAGQRQPYLFFNADEADFIQAAVARLIPADESGPGALEAAVPAYIDQQLAGAWGAGERLYRSGPWQAGKEGQGYQLPFTPAELFRNALRGIAADLGKAERGKFSALNANEQDEYLRSLEAKPRDLGGVPSDTFFDMLLTATVEGFFSDPVYGGNKDMIGWKLVGFPGAYANYYELVDQHGIAFTRPPISLAQGTRKASHPHPVNPQQAPQGR
jgi:gluconate 2-dehydrogenase gamma chain